MINSKNLVGDEISGCLSNLTPLGWQTAKLGDLVSIQTGYPFDSNYFSETPKGDSKRVIRIRDLPPRHSSTFYTGLIDSKIENEYTVNRGDILIGMDGYFHICRWPNSDDLVNQRVARLWKYKEALLPDYVYYAIQKPIKQIENDKHYTTVKHLSIGDLRELVLSLPPLAEQRAIARVLTTVRQAIEATERVIEATRQLKKAMMKHLFTYGTVPVHAVDGVRLKETEIGWVPEGWGVTKIGDVTKIIDYGINSRAERTGTFAVLRMNNLQEGKIEIDDLKYVELSAKDFQKYRLDLEDVLFNRTNSFELVGKTSLFDHTGDFVFASYLVRIRAKTGLLSPRFLNYYLNWEVTQSRLKSLATRGVSQSNISASKLSEFQIPLPALEIQLQIAEALKNVDEKLLHEARRKKGLISLSESLLDNLMTGKMRLNAPEFLLD